jgi:cytoskeletal protein RodZ
MAEAEVTYETKPVRAIRGTESRTVAKWKADGWELVSQTPGKLRTELIFRRPKPKSRRLLWAVVGGGVAVILAGVITFGAIGERNAAVNESSIPTSSESSSTPSDSPSAAMTTQPAEPSTAPEDVTVTVTPENNTEFAALLTLTDYCDPSIAAFAAAFVGQTVEFSANISAMGPHDGATTRYDILIGAGDFSETSAPGPAFQFRDVNTTYDLHFTGPTPDTVGERTNLVVTAEVVEYEPASCLFLLDPVSTVVR